MSQLDLFDSRVDAGFIQKPARYPEVPGAVDVDTSIEAAESLVPTVGGLRAKVLELVATHGEQGLTCEELEDLSGLAHQTASARLRELEMMGLALKTPARRTNRSGRTARVYLSAAQKA